jgi:hypothetical protein
MHNLIPFVASSLNREQRRQISMRPDPVEELVQNILGGLIARDGVR